MTDEEFAAREQASRAAVARVRRERGITVRHDCGAADDGPDADDSYLTADDEPWETPWA